MRYDIYFYPACFKKKFKTAVKISILSLFSHHEFIQCDFSKGKLELPVKVEWGSRLITGISQRNISLLKLALISCLIPS